MDPEFRLNILALRAEVFEKFLRSYWNRWHKHFPTEQPVQKTPEVQKGLWAFCTAREVIRYKRPDALPGRLSGMAALSINAAVELERPSRREVRVSKGGAFAYPLPTEICLTSLLRDP